MHNIRREPQPHGTLPAQTPAQHPPSRSALGWAQVGLSATCCTTGVLLTLTGHNDLGIALIHAGALGGSITINITGK